MNRIICLAVLLIASVATAADLHYADPVGDDFGPGTYVYPTDSVYTRGSFDLKTVRIVDDGDDVIFEVVLAARINDPWRSDEWGGNGFSLQFVQIYLDLDRVEGSGHQETLPGLNVRFAPANAWDKVVLISPQGKTRLQSEINSKAAGVKGDVVVPRITRARGKKLKAIVSRKALGASPAASWGVQAVVQSNEGYPARNDLLTRGVNEYPGAHRFGGGSDWSCDPHVIDILAGAATGGEEEKKAQIEALRYTCDPQGEPTRSTRATLPMIYRKP